MGNRLCRENSPYLLAHADDPVGWFPWGPEALRKAREENLPVFLSLGFSACHWCHVNHRESFLDPGIAEILNSRFVPVKVDRQERPDIDAVYMAFCTAMTGGGGWPLTAILTPEGLPFFIGTYFPPRSTSRMPGLMEILEEITRRWDREKLELARYAAQLAEKITPRPFTPGEHAGIAPRKAVDLAFDNLARSSDPLNGGFGTAPKFPLPGNLLFLLAYDRLNPGSEALRIAVRHLESMRLGGIFDHLGYGFSRYSVDQKWQVPHFEKMLGDNALLALAYHEAGQAASRPALELVSSEVLEYLSRDMRREDGGYCSSEDADSMGEEGLFYTWTPEEIAEVLGREEAGEFCRVFNVTSGGNFERGRSVLWRSRKEGEAAELLHLDPVLERHCRALFEERSARVRPARDSSALAEWNGLMLGTLARVGTKRRACLDEARHLWGFCRKHLFDDVGRLRRVSYEGGQGVQKGCLDDYGALLWGLAELYGSTGEGEFLDEGERLCAGMESLFSRPGRGGFDFIPSDGDELPLRIRRAEDTGLPSGNGMAALGMARFYKFTGDPLWKEKALSVFSGFEPEIARFPGGFASLLSAVAEIGIFDAGGKA